MGRERLPVEVGQRFTSLVVTGEARDARNKLQYVCLCDCGKTVITTGPKLHSGHTKSCGCYALRQRTTHGLHKSAEYKILSGMRQRCYNKNYQQFADYGGKGVTICDRWLKGEDNKTGMECFIEDMGKRPSPAHSIDRIDSGGNYEPDNCRWATSVQQLNNTSRNRRISAFGETLTVAEWAKRFGLSYMTLMARLNAGKSLEFAVKQKPYERQR